jgi:hypothetical protein
VFATCKRAALKEFSVLAADVETGAAGAKEFIPPLFHEPRCQCCASPKLHPTEKLDKISDVLTVKSLLVPPLVLAESYENKGGRNFGEAQQQYAPHCRSINSILLSQARNTPLFSLEGILAGQRLADGCTLIKRTQASLT